jgi:hypothetical protein
MRLSLFTAALIVGAPLGLAQAQVTSSTPQPTTKPAPAKVITPPSTGGAATPTLVTTFVGGNDNCASAASTDSISGYGTFGVNNTAATTGTPVGSCGLMGRDVWFYWTAPATEQVTVSTCGLVTADPVVAIWNDGSPAGTCPTTQIVCLDDSCGLQQSVQFNAVAGTSYFIEYGSFNAGAGYNQSFSIAGPPPPVTNDACTSPVNLVGDGPHPFNTVGATTGAEGQAEPLCLFFGFTNIYNDVWYTWTASQTGLYELTLCNGTTHPDTRVAVYSGTGCPAAGTAIACNDDVCGFVSALCFSATAGQIYTIQIGAFGSGQVGQGNILFTPQTGGPSPCGPQDDGSSENSVGLTAGGALMWMVGFGAGQPSTTMSSIETCFGSPSFPGGYAPQGPVTVAVYDDPNDDGDPTDGVFVTSATAAVSPGSLDTDVFQSIALPASVTVNGIFFVTATVVHAAGEFPGPLDQSGGGSVCGGGGNPGSWVCGNTTGTMNFNNLAANDVPPLDMDLIGLPGNWLLRVTCGPSGPPGTPYCFGDGSGTACPCGPGAAGNGCPNSVNAAGANLAATGNATVGADTLLLTGSGMPATATALYFQGNAQISVVFGDGLRCVATNVVRLGTKTNVGGTSAYPAPGDQSISVRGGCAPGDSRNYQGWYRNAASFCTAATFNLTNGINVVWN